MKFKTLLAMTAVITATTMQAANPLLKPFKTTHGTYPFDHIKTAHYMPAFKEAIKQQQKEIEAIVNNPDEPTFQNTIVALE